ncbi:hypothetical protein [Promicromonospora sp. NPDC060271]|uniref:hypothetical protein n=1 Tax=Promicromonospora sp. NPDC060271 TaxID=3347089 RepID=UPI003657372A
MPNQASALRLQFADDMFLRRHDGEASPAVNQVLWRLDGPYSAHHLRELAAGLAAGSLHRRVVRARVPGARHRWAPAGTLPVLDLQTAAVAENAVGTWAQAQADLPLDPAGGRSWRLAAADVVADHEGGADGGAVVGGGIVSLTCAHAVADGAALIDAVVRASTRADPIVVPAPERGTRALLADAADATAQAAAVARWARAKARQVARERLAASTGASDAAVTERAPDVLLDHTVAHDEHSSSSRDRVVGADNEHDAHWRAPVLHLELPAERVAQVAAEHGGTPNTWFVAFLARLVHATGRFPGEPVPVALPVSTRGEDDPRANSTKIARVTIPADVLATRDLGWVRAAAKEAYTAVGRAEPGVSPVPLELVQMLPDTVVRKLPQPPVAAALASNLGTPPDGYTQATGGAVRAVATLSHYQGATAAELRAAGGGLVAFCTTAGHATVLSVAGLDPDRVADADTLRDLVLAEADVWQIPAEPW